jgi:hypothetical protein
MRFKYPEDTIAIVKYLKTPSIRKELDAELDLTEDVEY